MTLVVALAGNLTGCIGLVIGGAAVGVMAVTDRRTIGAQTEDQGIEFKASEAVRTRVKNPGGISVTSFNRKVLITGQVLDEQSRRDAESIVGKIENVRSVHNELAVSSRASLGTNTSDASITARVKTAFLEASDLHTNVFKVVTEAGTSFLMGVVTPKEGKRAADEAAKVSGVQKVVTMFEYISDEELAKMQAAGRQSK